MIEILITEETNQKAEELLKRQLPSSILDLWQYYGELSDCLWQIRNEINYYIDTFPTNYPLPGNYRFDPRFDDSKVKIIEERIDEKMEECSAEALRIEKEKETIAIKKIMGMLNKNFP